MKRIAAALVAMLGCTAALADDEQAWRRSVYFGLTTMQPQADRQLTEQDGHWSIAAGLQWRTSRHLAFDLAVIDTGQEAQMPQVERSGPGASGARQRENINVIGIAGTLKLLYPIGSFEPYAGAGVGLYGAEVSDYGALAHFILPSEFAKRRDSRAGFHYVLGMDYSLSPGAALGVEYRRLELEANFGPEFGGTTKIGGGIVVIAIRARVP